MKGFVLAIVLFSTLIGFEAAIAEPEYTRLQMEIEVGKPADELWAIAGGYCDISLWANIECEIVSGSGNKVPFECYSVEQSQKSWSPRQRFLMAMLLLSKKESFTTFTMDLWKRSRLAIAPPSFSTPSFTMSQTFLTRLLKMQT